MSHIGTDMNGNRPGGTIDSWCGKCKLVLAHTIEAMVGDKPARVQCNTCKAQHTYKANPPGNGTKRASKGGTSRYQSALKAKETMVAKTYSSSQRYEPGDVVDHPMFGRGVATVVKDENKVEILFESGPKVLIQGR